MKTPSSHRGFTLLELIIVIAILAVLSVAVILVINPAETLARARDSQRFSDLAAVKSAIGLYLSEVSPPDMDGANSCTTNTWIATTTPITDLGGACGSTTANVLEAGAAINGTGWVPVNLTAIPAGIGAPLSNYPLDPNPAIVAAAFADDGTNRTYVYRCDSANNTFELNTVLESTLYRTTQDVDANDGGNNVNVYEIGTDPGLDLCGAW